MKLIDAHKVIQEISVDQVPWAVRRMFAGSVRLEISGAEISFGEDFVSVTEAREAVEFLVDQLGGKVKWDK
jgi:hypothetical protein